jgi:hypothetical protein
MNAAAAALEADAGRTEVALWALALIAIAFFALRPELWRRLVLARIDPRPAGLMRIAFGSLLIWVWCGLLPLERELFTDEGLWLTEQARASARPLATLWDPVEGFERPWDLLRALGGSFSILHFRSDPLFVAAIWGVLLAALALMTAGLWTRWSTLAAWLAMHQLYGYGSIFFSSADHAIRAFLFLAVFWHWGEACSVDSWRRRRRAIEAGAAELPALRAIPAWPQRLMMLQLAVLYCATGLLKSGYTWKNGTALYYALNLDHFYRVPMTGVVLWLHQIGVLPLATRIVRHWEVAFPLVLVGLALRAWEREREAGGWPEVPPWRKAGSWCAAAAGWALLAWVAGITALHYWPPRPAPFGFEGQRLVAFFFAVVAGVPLLAIALYAAARRFVPRLWRVLAPWLLGRRTWLGIGVAMHVGIAVTMNVGAFSPVMLVAYIPWLTGADVDRLWCSLLSKGPVYRVRYAPTEGDVRRRALLRLWDVGQRLRFEPGGSGPANLVVTVDGRGTFRGTEAACRLVRIFPGLWWLWPACAAPGSSRLAGALAARMLRQR